MWDYIVLNDPEYVNVVCFKGKGYAQYQAGADILFGQLVQLNSSGQVVPADGAGLQIGWAAASVKINHNHPLTNGLTDVYVYNEDSK